MCIPCQKNCVSCELEDPFNERTRICSECDANFVLSDGGRACNLGAGGSCGDRQVAVTYGDNQKCLDCPDKKCTACEMAGTFITCTSCEPEFTADGALCFPAIKCNEKLEFYDSATKSCDICFPTCVGCTAASVCKKCIAGHTKNAAGLCVPSLTVDSVDCKFGAYLTKEKKCACRDPDQIYDNTVGCIDMTFDSCPQS